MITMPTTDSYLIVFMGILVSDILYQTGLLTKLYQRITHLEDQVNGIEKQLHRMIKWKSIGFKKSQNIKAIWKNGRKNIISQTRTELSIYLKD